MYIWNISEIEISMLVENLKKKKIKEKKDHGKGWAFDKTTGASLKMKSPGVTSASI